MKKILMLALVLLTTTAMAQKPAPKAPVLDAKDCQYLVAYQPSVDGSADYQPGVDVNGKPVVEADITPQVVQAPDSYTFQITVDVEKYMGVAHPSGVEALAPVGEVTVMKNGDVLFNGKPLEGDAEAALKALCANQKPSMTVK